MKTDKTNDTPFLTELAGGLVGGVLLVLSALSIAALVFSGDLSVHLDTGIGCRIADVLMLVPCRRGRIQLEQGVRPPEQSLPGGLRALEEVEAGLLPRRALRQLRDRADAR